MQTTLLTLFVLGTPLAALALLGQASPAPQGKPSEAPTRPQEGDNAPLLRLNDHRGEAVALGGDQSEQSRSWTVLAFFPKAATPG